MKRRHLITLPLAALLPHHLLAQTRDNIAAKKRPDAPYYLYPTQKLAQLPGYSMQQTYPPRNSFGGWQTNHGGRTAGKYRTEKQSGRWWLIDPSGNRCLHIAVVGLYNSGWCPKMYADKRRANKKQRRHGIFEVWKLKIPFAVPVAVGRI